VRPAKLIPLERTMMIYCACHRRQVRTAKCEGHWPLYVDYWLNGVGSRAQDDAPVATNLPRNRRKLKICTLTSTKNPTPAKYGCVAIPTAVIAVQDGNIEPPSRALSITLAASSPAILNAFPGAFFSAGCFPLATMTSPTSNADLPINSLPHPAAVSFNITNPSPYLMRCY